MAMSDVPPPDFFHALIEHQLRACKQLDRVFTSLSGNDPLQSFDQFKFMYKAAWRFVENKQQGGTRTALMQTSTWFLPCILADWEMFVW